MRRAQILRGTKVVNDAFIGRKGELTLNTDDYTLRIHDGETAGGHEVGVNTSSLERLFIDIAHPVGSWYASDDPTDPSVLFVGTTWQRLTGKRGLIACDSSTPVGTDGGSDVLTVEMLPAHSHTASTDSQGSHSHNRGYMNIWGEFGNEWNGGHGGYGSGAFSRRNGSTNSYDGGGKNLGTTWIEQFNANLNWGGSTNSAGSHAHTVTVDETGSGAEAMNPYYATYIWKRIS